MFKTSTGCDPEYPLPNITSIHILQSRYRNGPASTGSVDSRADFRGTQRGTHLSQANADFNYELTPDDHDEEFTTGRADHLGLLGYWVDLGDLVHGWSMGDQW